jgi:transcriptional regulator with XRE-family HTH domain
MASERGLEGAQVPLLAWAGGSLPSVATRSSAETGQPAVRIGRQIRNARRQRGMTIEQMAQATGLTKGFLSQVERDLAQTSVASLVRICNVLDIRIGTLFESSQPNFVPRSVRARVEFGGHGVEEFLLTPTAETRLQVIEQTIEPGGGSGDEEYTLESEAEFVHVLAGQLEVIVQGTPFLLEPGDSLTFSPRDEHTWRNPGDEQTHALWVFAPALV